MSESMRKIIFYENILEFKENRKEQLTLNEVNNWEICRTCLADTDANDVDVERMCVMDAIQGKFFSIKEMLTVIANIKISTDEKIATRVCTTCFNKITNLYYFTLQVRKAENILKRMAKKLKDDKSFSTDFKKEDEEEVEDKEPQTGNTDGSIIIEVEELFGYTPDMENAMEIDANIIEENESAPAIEEEEDEKMQHFHEKREKLEPTEDKDNFECLEELFQEVYEDIVTESNNNNNEDENIDEKQQLKSEPIVIDAAKSIEENEDTLSYADSFEELYITDAEFLEEDVSQTNDDASTLDTGEKPLKYKTQRIKHIQPRNELPLLEELKCLICEQKFDRQNELVNHVQDEHPNTQAFKCRFCSSAFAHIQSLSREFMRCDDLKRHIRTHTGERPYQCSYCEKSFKQQGEMKSHEETHLPKKTYYCTQCPKTFASRNGLYLHKRLHNNNYKMHNGRKKRVTKIEKQKEREKILQFSSEEGE